MKKPPKTDFRNFRPICRANNFCKLMEYAIYKYIHAHFNLFQFEQVHYCVPSRSVHTNLENTRSYIEDAWKQNNNCAILYIDISAAFDTVDRNMLLLLLENYFCVKGGLINLLRSLLCRRTYACQDPTTNITHQVHFHKGVPQGSSLSALLFTILLLPLLELYGDKILVYADNLKLFVNYHQKDLQKGQSELQELLNAVKDYLLIFNLHINTAKTHYMIFRKNAKLQDLSIYLNNIKIDRVFKCVDLGYTWSANLSQSSFLLYLKPKILKAFWLLKTKLHNINDFGIWVTSIKIWITPILTGYHRLLDLNCKNVCKWLNSIDKFIYRTVKWNCRGSLNCDYKCAIQNGWWISMKMEIFMAGICSFSKLVNSNIGMEERYFWRIPKRMLRARPAFCQSQTRFKAFDRSWPLLVIKLFNSSSQLDFCVIYSRSKLMSQKSIVQEIIRFMAENIE